MKPSTGSWDRVVAHADMDAFYASVEQLDDPTLRNRAIMVGPDSDRGVVLTASYEARRFGVGSAMPMARARRLCPDAMIVPARFERYQELSAAIMAVFAEFSPDVEPLSLDEAFLEMTGSEHFFGDPREMGEQLKLAVREATGGLTVSVGLSATKYVAKVASGFAKPDGLTLVPPEEAVDWLAPLPVSSLWGAGPKTQARLQAMNLMTIGDVARADPKLLVDRLGSAGSRFYSLAHARDPRRVESGRKSKSIGSERTLEKDVASRGEIESHLRRAADAIAKRLRKKSYRASGVRVKLKTNEFQLLTRQTQLPDSTDVAEILFTTAVELLGEFQHPGPFRLVGMAAFDLDDLQDPRQLALLGGGERERRLESTLDKIAERFGEDAVHRAGDLRDDLAPRLAADLDFLEDGGDSRDP